MKDAPIPSAEGYDDEEDIEEEDEEKQGTKVPMRLQ